MLAPPSSSDLLVCTTILYCHFLRAKGNIALDPKKLRTAKKAFSAATSTARDQTIDNTLWTETPAERQKRLEEETLGKRKRTANAESNLSKEEIAEKRRRQEADDEIRKRVEEHTVRVGSSNGMVIS